MTKEELEKEAEEYAEKAVDGYLNEVPVYYVQQEIEQGYLAGAEPREKRIAELEKENKTVSRKANEAIADKLLITAKYNEVLNDLNQENDNLKKENAELKSRDCWKGCLYASGKSDLIHEILQQQYNLTKAMKHLKDLAYVVELGKNELATARILAEAKEFLKEE